MSFKLNDLIRKPSDKTFLKEQNPFSSMCVIAWFYLYYDSEAYLQNGRHGGMGMSQNVCKFCKIICGERANGV